MKKVEEPLLKSRNIKCIAITICAIIFLGIAFIMRGFDLLLFYFVFIHWVLVVNNICLDTYRVLYRYYKDEYEYYRKKGEKS